MPLVTPAPLVRTIPDAAQLLQVSRSSVYRLIERGDLTLAKIGGRSMVTVDSIERLASGSAA